MEQIMYLGENGFRRSSKDQFIEFLNIVNINVGKTHIDIKNALARSNAYSGTKNVDDMNRVFNLFERLGLIDINKTNYELTKLGLKLIKGTDTLANTKFGFGGYEFLISLINYSESQKISIL